MKPAFESAFAVVSAACAAALLFATIAASPLARAQSDGKLLLTGGVASIDGAAGGGLTPWAVTGSYAGDDEVGATAHVTRVLTLKYAMTAYGATVGWKDRVEASVARQEFNASAAVPNATLKLDILGVKVKLAGDAVLDADTLLPQIAIGAQFKRLNPGAGAGAVLDSVAAKRSGVDFYLSATKLFLAPGLLVNGTLRATKANQNGLLGFGSSDKPGYTLQPEVSVALLLSKHVAIGAEYRAKPDKLRFAGEAFREDDWKDLFIVWAPNKNLSLTAAWVDLGNIVGHRRQTGTYLSAEVAY